MVLIRKYYKGTLREELNRLNPYFYTDTRDRLETITERLLKGLKEIHKQEIFLNDIKASNLLEDEYGSVFFMDFDRSCSFTELNDPINRKRIVSTGSFPYFSPDRVKALFAKNFEDFILSEKEDVWAIGLILYQFHFKEQHMLSSLLIDFQNESVPIRRRGLAREIAECITDIKKLYENKKASVNSDSLVRFIFQLLNPNAAERPSAEQAYNEFLKIR